MTYDKIKAAMDDLVAEMLAKGIKTPSAEFTIKSGSRDNIVLWCDTAARQLDGNYLKPIYGESPADIIAKARAYIAALPDPATEGERKFTRALAHAVDIATEYALPDAVVAPVRAAIEEVNALLLAAPK
jgi:hypothetical protein